MALLRQGRTFQDVWDVLLRGNPLVKGGRPHQRLDGPHVNIEVFLATGERLVYEPDCGEFHLESLSPLGS
jgi:hypothetical protein